MIFASTNEGKIKEVKKILNIDIKTLNDLDKEIIINETGNSFKENAIIKAKETYKITKMPVIAEDSGLEIDALNGFPGINTHRFQEGTDNDRNQALLKMMKDKTNRTCYFTSCFAYYNGKDLITSEYKLKGKIAKRENIKYGFGFDNIFLYKNKFLSNMTIDEKNAISPRKFALEKLIVDRNFKKNIDFKV